MMKWASLSPRARRAWLLAGALVLFGSVGAFVLTRLEDTIVYFRLPADIAADKPLAGTYLRIGGMVEPGSIKRKGARAFFSITDNTASVPVVFTGVLPDLFRAGQGVVAEGVFDAAGVFDARIVLAKHDETYRPPNAPPPDGMLFNPR